MQLSNSDLHALISLFIGIIIIMVMSPIESYNNYYYPKTPPNDIYLPQGPAWKYYYKEGRGDLLSSPLPQASQSLSPLPRQPIISAPTLFPHSGRSFNSSYPSIINGEGRGQI